MIDGRQNGTNGTFEAAANDPVGGMKPCRLS